VWVELHWRGVVGDEREGMSESVGERMTNGNMPYQVTISEYFYFYKWLSYQQKERKRFGEHLSQK